MGQALMGKGQMDEGRVTPAVMAKIHAKAFDTPWSEQTFASLLDSPGVFVCGDDHGFILIRSILDEGEILTVAVHPSARRTGRGKNLVEQAIVQSRAMGAERMFLEVARSNLAAQALYSSCGFEQAGLRRNYYQRSDGSTEDALVLVLNFLQ